MDEYSQRDLFQSIFVENSWNSLFSVWFIVMLLSWLVLALTLSGVCTPSGEDSFAALLGDDLRHNTRESSPLRDVLPMDRAASSIDLDTLSRRTPSDLTLVQVVMVSRHGIRTPFAPPFGTVTDYTAYTDKIFPDNNTWGMTYDAFANQHITPHGRKVTNLCLLVNPFFFLSYLFCFFAGDPTDGCVLQRIVRVAGLLGERREERNGRESLCGWARAGYMRGHRMLCG